MINAVNEQFSRFVAFAQERVLAGKEKAIASKVDLENGGSYNPRRLTPQPDDTIVMGSVKVVATMTIKNASDAELGNGMPEFTIDDIRQEEA